MAKKRSWQDLSAQTKMRIAVMGTIQVALLLGALWDIRQRAAEEIRGRKAMWVAISFVNFAGPIAYFLFGRRPEAQESESVSIA